VKTSPEILQLCIQKKALEQVHTSTSQHKLKLARVESVMKRTIQGGKYIYTVPFCSGHKISTNRKYNA
jgi:ABC-type uncharacterized transport system permease subunit